MTHDNPNGSMRALPALAAALVALCTSSCQMPSVLGGPPTEPANGTSPVSGLLPFQGAPATEPAKLYSRDGGVVSAAKPGTVASDAEPSATVAADSGSRMKVIELYQQVVEERDRLRKELGDTRAALAQSQQIIDTVQAELRLKDGAAGLSSQERDQLLKENADLAARLATAQIRRLEAEKALLEHLVAAAEAGEPNSDAPGKEQAAAGSARHDAVLGSTATATQASAEVAHSTKHP
jgi:hypothetical protein